MIIQGSAERLPLGDGTVDCCVTSPPYWGLRSYLPVDSGLKGLELGQERTPELYVSRLVGMFEEVRRVLKPQGTAWVVIGDCWATGAGKVGKCPGGGAQGEQWAGRGAYTRANSGKSAYRMPVGPTTQPNRLPLEGYKSKDLVGIPFMVGFALRAAGWWWRNVEIWCKTNGMPGPGRDRATVMHEYILMLTKRARCYYDYEAVKVPASMNGHDRIGARKGRAREGLKSWPAGERNGIRRDKQRGHSRLHAGFNARWDAMEKLAQCSGYRNRWSWRCLATAQYRGPHYAVYPEDLIEPYVLASCPVGGVVLDPFGGTGVTVAVAERLGRKGIGIELNWEYCGLGLERLRGKQIGCC